MYILILAIHAVFIFISHFLEYRIFEGIFIILCIFFLFYFSPLFFTESSIKEDWKTQDISLKEKLSRYSPKDSLIIPVIFLYIALYGFVFSIFGNIYPFISLHTGMVIFIFLIFLGYGMSFYWKHDVFFDLLRFHSIFTLISSIIFVGIFLYTKTEYTLLYLLLSVLGFGSSTFLLQYTKKENPIFLTSFWFGVYVLFYNILLSTALYTEFSFILFCLSVISILFFEYTPKIKILLPYTQFFQYFSLFSLFLILPVLLYIAFTTIQALIIFLLIGIAIFFLSIHIRYTNYIVFLICIILTYSLYGLIFIDLLLDPTIFSSFLFIFFLPILLIGITYFSEEQHQYDFIILHYSSLFFSTVFSFYSIFFVPWWENLLFITSLSFFGVALLLFMSYFRFRKESTFIL